MTHYQLLFSSNCTFCSFPCSACFLSFICIKVTTNNHTAESILNCLKLSIANTINLRFFNVLSLSQFQFLRHIKSHPLVQDCNLQFLHRHTPEPTNAAMSLKCETEPLGHNSVGRFFRVMGSFIVQLCTTQGPKKLNRDVLCKYCLLHLQINMRTEAKFLSGAHLQLLPFTFTLLPFRSDI